MRVLLTSAVAALTMVTGVSWAYASTPHPHNAVTRCAAQIRYNIENSPNVYGPCDGLSDAQIRAASRLATR